MTDQKILQVIRQYELMLSNSVEPQEFRSDQYGPEKNQSYAHILQMIPKMRKFLRQGRREKVMRWLGFMQGVFWDRGNFCLDDLQSHSKPSQENEMKE